MAIHPEITSTKNPIVKRFRAAASGEEDGLVVDGLRLVWDAVRAGARVSAAAVSPKLRSNKSGHELRSRLASAAADFYECSDRVLERMSSLDTPQGVIAIVERPKWNLDRLLEVDGKPLIVVAAGVRDPGNLGAIVRTAEAAGATGFVALAGSADPFRDKAVRGSSGSVLRLPCVRGIGPRELGGFVERAGLRLVVADGSADSEYVDADFTEPAVVVVGAEGDGVPSELLEAGHARVRIPMREPVDSLNVAVAAGVLLFEARRQRR